MDARNAATEYLARSWAPIPIPWRAKAPTLPGWPELRITAENLGEYFNGARQNIGVLFGDPSGGLVDIDLDCPEAVIAARHLLPNTGSVFGRSGSPLSHYLFKCAGARTRKYADAGGVMLVELRSTGCQTIVPPSAHPSGEIVEWVCDNAPVEIEGARLTRIVGLVAAAALIARRWPTHGRHDAALALAGALRRANWTLAQAEIFMLAVVESAHDEEAADRVRAVKDTFAEGGATTGWPRLGEILGLEVAGRAREWLAAEDSGAATVPEALGLTDLGNAHRFARDHGADVRYCWPWSKWLVWDGRFWNQDDSGEIHRLAEATIRKMYEEALHSAPERREALAKWAVKSESHERRSKMLASAQAIAGIPVLPKDLDRDLWLLNVLNGTIDLRTGTLRPHTREDLITRCLNVAYDPDAASPYWERFLGEVFGGDDDVVLFAQRAVGYSITGLTSEHVLLILYGRGSNGKSTFLDALHEMLDAYAARIPAELLMARRGEHHPTERATLYQKRFVSTAETGDGRRLNEDLVKALTGGDSISCRRMREDFWEFKPTHKLVLATNHKPVIRGTDHAIWRRIRLIPFNVTFHDPETELSPQQDPELPSRLREEVAGILAWAVRGCLDWQRQGLRAPKAVRAATEEYRAEQDTLGLFLEECCVLDKRSDAPATALYRGYSAWCEQAGERPETQTSFGRRLRERGLASHKGRDRNVWLGIGLLAVDSVDSVDPFCGSICERNDSAVYTEKGSTTIHTIHKRPPPAASADGVNLEQRGTNEVDEVGEVSTDGAAMAEIRGWLQTLGEDPESISDVLEACARDPAVMAGYLRSAREVAP